MDWERSYTFDDVGCNIMEQDLTQKRTFYCSDGRFFVKLSNSRWETVRFFELVDLRGGYRWTNLVNNRDIDAWIRRHGIKAELLRWWSEDASGIVFDSERSFRDNEKPKKQRLVYFILDVINRVVKIGISDNPASRMNGLRTSNASELKLLVSIPGDSKKEKELQNKFSHLRVKGEWFTYNDEIENFISSLI